MDDEWNSKASGLKLAALLEKAFRRKTAKYADLVGLEEAGSRMACTVCSMRSAARAFLAFKLSGIIGLRRKGAITHHKCQDGFDQDAWPVDHTCYLDTSCRLIKPGSVTWTSVSWSWNTMNTRRSPCYITIQVAKWTVKTVFKPQISTQYNNALWWLKTVFIGTAYFWRLWWMVVNRHLYFQGSKYKKVGNHSCKLHKGC